MAIPSPLKFLCPTLLLALSFTILFLKLVLASWNSYRLIGEATCRIEEGCLRTMSQVTECPPMPSLYYPLCKNMSGFKPGLCQMYSSYYCAKPGEGYFRTNVYMLTCEPDDDSRSAEVTCKFPGEDSTCCGEQVKISESPMMPRGDVRPCWVPLAGRPDSSFDNFDCSSVKFVEPSFVKQASSLIAFLSLSAFSFYVSTALAIYYTFYWTIAIPFFPSLSRRPVSISFVLLVLGVGLSLILTFLGFNQFALTPVGNKVYVGSFAFVIAISFFFIVLLNERVPAARNRTLAFAFISSGCVGGIIPIYFDSSLQPLLREVLLIAIASIFALSFGGVMYLTRGRFLLLTIVQISKKVKEILVPPIPSNSHLVKVDPSSLREEMGSIFQKGGATTGGGSSGSGGGRGYSDFSISVNGVEIYLHRAFIIAQSPQLFAHLTTNSSSPSTGLPSPLTYDEWISLFELIYTGESRPPLSRSFFSTIADLLTVIDIPILQNLHRFARLRDKKPHVLYRSSSSLERIRDTSSSSSDGDSGADSSGEGEEDIEFMLMAEYDVVTIPLENLVRPFTNLSQDYRRSDISLIASDGVDFEVHKCVLTARSPYFARLLSSVWQRETGGIGSERSGSGSVGGGSGRVESGLNYGRFTVDCSADVLDVLVCYMYTDTLSRSVSAENVVEALLSARYYSLERLSQLCARYIIQRVDASNVDEMLHFSREIDCIPLKRGCVQYITDKQLNIDIQSRKLPVPRRSSHSASPSLSPALLEIGSGGMGETQPLLLPSTGGM
eukprot:TRINITY_DN178_c0_g3_i1.p1 TRINITY_DN178_c0_g3~~TRINITY_DN178_c0_g3_i1.p1  ORF type:complete len:779 (-),score=110.62 TRINITY_DN178_c0_g3_i1:232-2568(-)